MGRLIDSSVLISLERRGQSPEVLLGAAEDVLVISAVTVSELLVGLHRAQTQAQQARRRAFLESTLSAFPVLPFDLLAAEVHAKIWAGLAAAGQLIGTHDAMIAATALANDHEVLTENIREFSRVPSLVVRAPAW